MTLKRRGKGLDSSLERARYTATTGAAPRKAPGASTMSGFHRGEAGRARMLIARVSPGERTAGGRGCQIVSQYSQILLVF